MEKEVFKSKYSRILVDEDKNLVIQEWFDNTKMMEDEQFRKEMYALAELGYERYKPKKVLILQKDFYFIVSPELQTWASDTIGTILESVKAEKIAFVVSEDLFSKISVEQTMDEKPDTKIQIRFFDDEAKAREWLEV